MKYKLHTNYKKLLADTYTPVGIYLKLRDKFPNSILLESSDYHSNENSSSFICSQPIASFKIEHELISENFPDGKCISRPIGKHLSVPKALKDFAGKFEMEGTGLEFARWDFPLPGKLENKFVTNGLFGYTTYDSLKYFEDITVHALNKEEKLIPEMIYSVYKYVIAIDHFKDELFLFENCLENEASLLDNLESFIRNRGVTQFRFTLNGNEESNLTNEEYQDMVRKGKEECLRGNLLQLSLSREFMQKFKGDEFNVYRALRSINPSPYLFYFDYGNFKIFGSSPEAQLVVKEGRAHIHPIAGTFNRTGDDDADVLLTEKLHRNIKENSDHVRLVDLAKNDLGRNCMDVKVEVLAETQYYSHVIHVVSKVTGKLQEGSDSIQVFADTFPAGTLSGAPKVKAIRVIDSCENDSRGYYGGAIGFLGFNGEFNHAIIIRSFLSRNNTLYYRAGADVGITSHEENELQEVNNKLKALKNAIEMAERV